MDISSKISKVKNYRKISDSEYQLQAAWTSSDMVEMNNGNSLEKELENLNTDIDNKLSALETNIDWKETVETYDDIATIYPNPEDGWTVNTKDNNITYRYNGSEWVAISANAIPKATDGVDGLLSKEDHAKYDDAVSKAHTHDNKSVLDGITSDKVTAWDNKSDFSGNYLDLNNKPTIPKGDGITITMDEDGTLHGQSKVSEMTGSTAEKDGTSGTVPAPTAGQETHILNGDGTWTSPLDNKLIASKFKELDENKSDVVIDKSTGKKVVFTIENGIICAREA